MTLVDASWAGCVDARKFTVGFHFKPLMRVLNIVVRRNRYWHNLQQARGYMVFDRMLQRSFSCSFIPFLNCVWQVMLQPLFSRILSQRNPLLQRMDLQC